MISVFVFSTKSILSWFTIVVGIIYIGLNIGINFYLFFITSRYTNVQIMNVSEMRCIFSSGWVMLHDVQCLVVELIKSGAIFGFGTDRFGVKLCKRLRWAI